MWDESSDEEFWDESAYNNVIVDKINGADMKALLTKYEPFFDYTFEEKCDYLQSHSFTTLNKYKIIVYFTSQNYKKLLLFLKNDLLWNFDFTYLTFHYYIFTIVYANSLKTLKYYFEELKLPYNYFINNNIEIDSLHFNDLYNNDILYTSSINNTIYDFSIFEYVFNKVIANVSPKSITSSMLFNIINCDNPEFIINIIEKYNLDINYVDEKTELTPLIYGIQRCSYETIELLNKKYNCNTYEKIKNNKKLQEYVFHHIFKYYNMKSNKKIRNFYFIGEENRLKLLEKYIPIIDTDIVNNNMKIVYDIKDYIDYDNIIYLLTEKIYSDNTIKNICSCCNKHVKINDNNDYFWLINKTKIYHSHCYDNADADDNNADDNDNADTKALKVYLNTCSICLNEEVHKYLIFSCGHMICYDCSIPFSESSNTCSMCRCKYDIECMIIF